jgi:predicted transposase YbfD/YdcC
MDHTSRAVFGQTDVDGPTNEIARFRPLLDGLGLTDTVVTADALHTQREHADWLVTAKHAAYLLMVRANQPTLHHQLRRLSLNSAVVSGPPSGWRRWSAGR